MQKEKGEREEELGPGAAQCYYISPPRRQLCRPNPVLFMHTPSQKKRYSSRLLGLILNYSSSREMYPD